MLTGDKVFLGLYNFIFYVTSYYTNLYKENMSYYHENFNQISMCSSDSSNKYVYFKQNFIPNSTGPVPSMCNKVLVNPHFNKKVFVNPNYKPNSAPSRTIHINPNVTSINFSGDNTNRTTSSIHVNPKVLNTGKEKPLQRITYSSKTKLIRSPVKVQTVQESKKVRSIFSKFKIVKSPQGKVVLNTKYKLRRLSSNKLKKVQKTKLNSRFKVDNRINNKPSSKSKFVFVNRFVSISDIAKNVPLKRNRKLNLVNISGIIYKKSPNHLQRVTKKEKKRSSTLNQNKEINRTRYKIVRTQIKPENRKLVKNILSRYSLQKNNSTGRLKKCNIPCPYFRKFGKCKGNDMGKCPRKHDPNQIALCTKFLQGACINSKCLLSHNVSPEKMPTCKFYLEGSCSKDNCPYLHVKISPKADVCRDFLEGFCKKASECDKRHQFLCPDFEKKGECVKARCTYPHGRMVRKYYSDFNKEKFAKKSSKTEKEEINATARYYSDQNIESININTNKLGNFRLRPKLGELPSFILLEEK